ncbi:ABC transporter permease [Desulfosarcina sp.]|uniref:ABC transporter permease n=1 Tax=Desulfosarcina sp. TaxID=2027861 RepID=UPI003970ACAE
MIERLFPGTAAQRRSRIRLLVQIGPGTLWIGMFFFLPLILILIYSFYQFTDGRVLRVLTLENYARALSQSIYYRVFLKSLWYGIVVTLITLVIGYPCAHFLARSRFRRKDILFAGLIVPFWTTIVVRIYAWKILLGSKGIVNGILLWAGLVDTPLKLLYTQTAVFFGLIHVFLPFMILPLYASIEKIDRALEEAAMDLGAGRLKTFLRVNVPLSLPGINTGCLLVFILTVGSYLTPELLGGPKEIMIANIIQREYYESFNWPFGFALAVLLLLVVLFLVVVYNRLFRLERIGG